MGVSCDGARVDRSSAGRFLFIGQAHNRGVARSSKIMAELIFIVMDPSVLIEVNDLACFSDGRNFFALIKPPPSIG